MFVPNPFYAQHDDAPQFMDHFQELPTSAQRVIIAVILVTVIAAIVVLRDMISTEEVTRQEEEMLHQGD